MHYHVEKLSGVKSCLLCLVESAIQSVCLASAKRAWDGEEGWGPHLKDISGTASNIYI